MKKEDILGNLLILAIVLFMFVCFLQMCDETPRDMGATLARKLCAGIGFSAGAFGLGRLRRAGRL